MDTAAQASDTVRGPGHSGALVFVVLSTDSTITTYTRFGNP